KKTGIGIILTLISAGCLQAKKSAFDIRSPSGVIFGVGISLISTQAAPAAVSSSFSYSLKSYTFYAGTAIPNITPTVTDGPLSSFTVSPSLPAGLSIDSSTGTISGSPSSGAASALYTVSAVNTSKVSSSSQITVRISTTTASLVYGQSGSFTTNVSSVTASGLSASFGFAADSSGNVYIADTVSSRILYYASGTTTASRVYGQNGSFISAASNNGGRSASSLYNPQYLTLDSADGLYAVDNGNNRVLYYPSGQSTASKVYGQGGDFTSNLTGLTASSFGSANGTAVNKSNGVYVTDNSNNRVLYFSSGSFTASKVYGQTDYVTGTSGLSSSKFSGPGSIAVDSQDGLYVTDTNNNRVLYFSAGSTTASRVYGQPNFTSNLANNGGISASTLNSPYAVTVDSLNGVYIADTGNNRVLYYPPNSTAASLVFGQTNFTGNAPGTTATTLNTPRGVAVDSANRLYIMDNVNSRVLGY
ncbi:MAG TPA: NHL repeat-containing protein, partial [Leptospiraceae bacterium]|nr:NHL repeat-containing protein [Leptospiraceae bacterium]